MIIKFCSKMKLYASIMAVVIIVGIVMYFVNGGLILDIQFKGGAILKYSYTGSEITTEKAESITESTLNRKASCQITTENATGNTFLVINLAGEEGLAADQQILLDDALKSEFSASSISLYETSIVEPFIGAQFLRNGITAIVLAFILIILYIGYRFRKIGGISAGVTAILALMFDCVVVFFTFVVMKMPIGENYVVSTLTIIGLAINNTIVIYDRVRENMMLNSKKLPIEEIVDKSITQSLTRSINTSGALLVSTIILCVFAQIYQLDSILTLALPITAGSVSGLFTSICVAGPLWVIWKKREQKSRA